MLLNAAVKQLFSYRRFSARLALISIHLAPVPRKYHASRVFFPTTTIKGNLQIHVWIVDCIIFLCIIPELIYSGIMSFILRAHNIVRRSDSIIATLSSRLCSKSGIFSMQQARSYSIPIENSNCSQLSNGMFNSIFHNLFLPTWGDFIWLIKRTFQPSVLRKRRKTGFLSRHKSTGGRKILKRRIAKGRARLGGC